MFADKMGDVEKGKKLFVQRCAACHNAEQGAKHKQGPNLFGMFGNKTGQAPGYTYTEANLNRGKCKNMTFSLSSTCANVQTAESCKHS